MCIQAERSLNRCSTTTPSGGERVASWVFLSHSGSLTWHLRGQSTGYTVRLGIVKETGSFLAKRGSDYITYSCSLEQCVSAITVLLLDSQVL